MSLKIYDPDQVIVVICGIRITGGYAEDSFIEFDQDSDDFEDVAGVDGEVTRSKTNDRRGTITLRLMQSADANNALSVLSNLDRSAHNGAGVGPTTIKDKGGTSLFVATKSWVAKPPPVTFARKAKEREWKIRCAVVERLDGGN